MLGSWTAGADGRWSSDKRVGACKPGREIDNRTGEHGRGSIRCAAPQSVVALVDGRFVLRRNIALSASRCLGVVVPVISTGRRITTPRPGTRSLCDVIARSTSGRFGRGRRLPIMRE